jgi:hypothetical protein
MKFLRFAHRYISARRNLVGNYSLGLSLLAIGEFVFAGGDILTGVLVSSMFFLLGLTFSKGG